MARTFDVWVQASNTIYRGVPFNVVTDWAQQGRLSATDRLRPAGTESWSTVADDPIIADFLFVRPKQRAAGPAPALALEAADVAWHKLHQDGDDDVDMIPLIDISLVLLIFFMMTSAVAALSPIDVPQMKHAFNVTAGDDLLVTIDRRANGDASYGVRVGDRPAAAGDADLDSLPLLLQRLDLRLEEMLNRGQGPPEVRFACHRLLPSERVHELVKELEKRKTAGKIASYRAEVNERK